MVDNLTASPLDIPYPEAIINLSSVRALQDEFIASNPSTDIGDRVEFFPNDPYQYTKNTTDILDILYSRPRLPDNDNGLSYGNNSQLRYSEVTSIYIGSDGNYYVATTGWLYVPAANTRFRGQYEELDSTLWAPGTGALPPTNGSLTKEVLGTYSVTSGAFIDIRLATPEEIAAAQAFRQQAIENGFTLEADGTWSAPSTECFGPETPIDMWTHAPEYTQDPANPNKIFNQDAVRAKVWKKPIAMIRKGDVVVSFDKNDNLMPGRVSRTFENEAKVLLDYFGTRVTPGHVYFRPDSKKTDKFECLLDILRDDGMIQNVEGKNIRAATNVPVGDPRDGFVWAITQERKDGILVEKERGRIRLGTRLIVAGKASQCVADVIAAKGGIVGDDELIRFGHADPVPFVWEHGATLPKPEDFVLRASGTTVADIYKAGEWESRRPHMPAPMVMDGGPVQPLSATALSAMPRNQPLNLQPAAASASAPKRNARPPMNRKQRKAMEAKQRKSAKVRKRAAV